MTFRAAALVVKLGQPDIYDTMIHAEGLIDEISLVISPVLEADSSTPGLADASGVRLTPQSYSLQSVCSQSDGSLWLHYVKAANS